MKTIVDYFAKTYGVKRGGEILAQFRPVLERWVDLVQHIESRAQLNELYWDEVFSKIDVARYGM